MKPPRQPFVRRIWTSDEDALFDVHGDSKIAVILTIDRRTARSRRLELGGQPFRTQKRIHDDVCRYCQQPFRVFGGRKSQLRTTCPPPKKCQWKQGHKTRKRLKSKANMRQLQGLYERHILRDK